MKARISRRMKILLLLALSMTLAGCVPTTGERSEILMGTVVTLKAEGGDAQTAVDETFNRIAELEENIRADAKRIEDAAGKEFVPVSPEVFEILETAQIFNGLTGGAFDVTCGAAVELWGIGTDKARIPTDAELVAVKNLVGANHLHLRDGAAYLDLRGVKLNLGGIAKGYGVDLARKIFNRCGVKSGLIDFGTSTIYAVGKKRIGIKNPSAPSELAAIVELENAALSTSGDYEKFLIADNRRYPHIIEPKTCAPVDNGISSVSVVVEGTVENCATVADILSTAAFVLGEERAETFIEAIKLPAEIIFADWQKKCAPFRHKHIFYLAPVTKCQSCQSEPSSFVIKIFAIRTPSIALTLKRKPFHSRTSPTLGM